MATILVIDDHAANRQYLATLLGYQGHRVLEASDGAEGLDLVRAERPALVITDLLMPRMDGYEFVRRMRSDPDVAATPVVFCTAEYQPGESGRLAEAGGVVHELSKPAEPAEVLGLVERILHAGPAPAPPRPGEEFDREHLRVLTDKLAQQVSRLEVANARASALLALDRQLAFVQAPGQLIASYCAGTREMIGVRRVGILWADGGPDLDPADPAAAGLEVGAGEAAAPGLGEPERALLRAVLETGRPARLAGRPSLLGVPIASPTVRYGVLYLVDKLGRDAFDDEDETFAVSLAAQLAVALQNALQYELIREQNARLEEEVASRARAEAALRESQDRLLLALESARMATWDLDVPTGRLVGSPGFEAVLGYGLDSGLEGFEEFARRIHPDDREPRSRALATAIETGALYKSEYRVILPDGGTRWVASRGRRHLGESGDVARMTGVVMDVTESKEAARLLEEYAGRLKDLTRRLMEVQESERRHLARELHDEIGQSLTAVKILLQRALPDPAGAGEWLAEGVAIVDQTLQQVRGMALDLRPSLLDDLGLVAALGWYVDRHARRTGMTGRFVADPEEIHAGAEVETACFRVVQEALTNVARHAKAGRFSVELLQHQGGLELVVRDDGVGFDPVEAIRRASRGASLGLAGIRERVGLLGGRVEFVSRPGEGTEVQVSFPAGPAPPPDPGRGAA